MLAEIIQRNLNPPPKILLYSALDVPELRAIARRVRSFDSPRIARSWATKSEIGTASR